MAIVVTYTLAADDNDSVANGYQGFTEARSEIIGLANGGFAVAYASGSLTFNVPLVTFFDASGNQIGSFGNSSSRYSIPYDFPSPAADVDLFGDPEVVELSNGNVAVIWKSSFAATNQVMVTTFNPTSGANITTAALVSGNALDADPEAATLSNGDFVVAMSTGATVVLQRMTAAGATTGGLLSAGSLVAGSEFNPAVAGLTGASGGIAVVYQIDTGSGGNGIGLKIFDNNGNIRLTETDIVVPGGVDSATEPAIAALDGGNFVVAWRDSNDGVRYQVFSSTGTPFFGSPPLVNTTTSGTLERPDIAVLSNGMFVIGFENTGSWPTSFMSRAFQSDGTPLTGVVSIDLDGSDISMSGGLDGGWFMSHTSPTPEPSGSSSSIAYNRGFLVRTTTGDSAANTLVGDDLTDIMSGGGADDTLTGGRAGDVLRGDGGNDTLFGQLGEDLLLGGTGADTLNGGAGGDSLQGDSGSDYYVVDSVLDSISENSGNGSADRVATSVSYSLSSGIDIEIMTTSSISGTTAINLTGNEVSQTLTGNDGNNRLTGGLGNDVLSGRGGSDVFRFINTPSGTNLDRVTDYNVADDRIELNDGAFSGLPTGALAASRFAANLTGAATTADHRIIYETDTGNLFFDADGNGAGARVRFAILDAGLAMTAAEFLVI